MYSNDDEAFELEMGYTIDVLQLLVEWELWRLKEKEVTIFWSDLACCIKSVELEIFAGVSREAKCFDTVQFVLTV